MDQDSTGLSSALLLLSFGTSKIYTSSLTTDVVTVLCPWARHLICYLVPIQLRRHVPSWLKTCWLGHKYQNKRKIIHVCYCIRLCVRFTSIKSMNCARQNNLTLRWDIFGLLEKVQILSSCETGPWHFILLAEKRLSDWDINISIIMGEFLSLIISWPFFFSAVRLFCVCGGGGGGGGGGGADLDPNFLILWWYSWEYFFDRNLNVFFWVLKRTPQKNV